MFPLAGSFLYGLDLPGWWYLDQYARWPQRVPVTTSIWYFNVGLKCDLFFYKQIESTPWSFLWCWTHLVQWPTRRTVADDCYHRQRLMVVVVVAFRENIGNVLFEARIFNIKGVKITRAVLSFIGVTSRCVLPAPHCPWNPVPACSTAQTPLWSPPWSTGNCNRSVHVSQSCPIGGGRSAPDIWNKPTSLWDMPPNF